MYGLSQLDHPFFMWCSAIDGKDGDVTSRVVVTGWASRDTSVIGKQVLTYTVSDSDLNVAFAVRYVSHCLLSYISCMYVLNDVHDMHA